MRNFTVWFIVLMVCWLTDAPAFALVFSAYQLGTYSAEADRWAVALAGRIRARRSAEQ